MANEDTREAVNSVEDRFEGFEVALINLDRMSLTASLAKSRFVSLGGTCTIPYRSTRGKVTMAYYLLRR